MTWARESKNLQVGPEQVTILGEPSSGMRLSLELSAPFGPSLLCKGKDPQLLIIGVAGQFKMKSSVQERRHARAGCRLVGCFQRCSEPPMHGALRIWLKEMGS